MLFDPAADAAYLELSMYILKGADTVPACLDLTIRYNEMLYMLGEKSRHKGHHAKKVRWALKLADKLAAAGLDQEADYLTLILISGGFKNVR